MQSKFPDFQPRTRVVHSRYGRGVILKADNARCLAVVRFDGERESRNALMANLALEPADMVAGPASFVRAPFAVERRLCWPLDRSGEPVR